MAILNLKLLLAKLSRLTLKSTLTSGLTGTLILTAMALTGPLSAADAPAGDEGGYAEGKSDPITPAEPAADDQIAPLSALDQQLQTALSPLVVLPNGKTCGLDESQIDWERVFALLTAGAQLSTTNTLKLPTLCIAANSSSPQAPEIVAKLLAHPACDVNAHSHDQLKMTALMLAAGSSNPQAPAIVKQLL
ncbi:MAG TPA: hypothetical protein VJJ83_02335, partial [Candidatus Babeliales bacterium]|nr:hypothetical protein [Candidatus Babeliales bacterium]